MRSIIYTGAMIMKIAIFTDTYLPQVNGVTRTYRLLLDFWPNRV